MLLQIDYQYLKRWKPIVFTNLIVILLYQSVVYLHPENLEWIKSDEFSLSNTIHFVFIDQFLIECITVAILFQLIRIYGNRMNLKELHLSIGEIVKYELRFLPVLLLSFFVFAPFTLSVRFLYHYLPDLNWVDYFDIYFYSTKLYLNYLTPILLVGYVTININLIRNYNQQLQHTGQQLTKEKQRLTRTRLWAADDFGELFLDVEKIKWIERRERKTFASIDPEEYRLKEIISELEEKLRPDQFVRINRSVIVNLSHVLNYSFWENDKYILRMKNKAQTEFVMSRDRLNKIKDRLAPIQRSFS